MSSPTILMIAPFPSLPDSGSGIVIFNDLRELNERGVTVDLICFKADRTTESMNQLEQYCDHLVLIDGPLPWSPGVILRALLQQQPMLVVRHKSSQMAATIAQQLAERTYNVVLVEFSFMFQYFLQTNLSSTGTERPLFAIDHHVVTPKVYDYFRQVERNPLMKLFRRYEIPRLKQYLKKVLETGDKHLFLGQEDLTYVKSKIPGFTQTDKLVYRPTGLLLDRYPLADPDKVEPYTIGFFGAFDWEANIDAVLYFVKEIFPLIQQRLPQTRLILAGRAAPVQIRSLGEYSSIEFLGEVEDMFAVAQRAAIIAAPLRIGAGTRLKILEAMAWGKPVVTTSIGIEGVEHTAGEDVLIANSPVSFAETVITLLRDPAQQRRLAVEGRRRVELSYTVQHSVDKLQEALTVPLETI